MATYTTEQVIDLVTTFLYNEVSVHHDVDTQEFIDWLKAKEKQGIPVKGQMIWVRDVGNHNEYYGTWHLREFHSFQDGAVLCIQRNQPDMVIAWDEYSIVDPNK